MKKSIFLLIGIILLSCNPKLESETVDITHLENKLLKFSEGLENGEVYQYPKIPVGNIFNFYADAIKLNSNGTYYLYFGGYEDNPEYKIIESTKDLHWIYNEGKIELETGRIDDYIALWNIEDVDDSNIVVSEISEDGNNLQYTLKRE
jgi:hypothetical protein